MIGRSTIRLANRIFLCLLLWLAGPARSTACDLCAIYRATNARGESASGFLFTISEQYIHQGTLQKDGEPYPDSPSKNLFAQAFLTTSITHLVPAYNFSEQFGVSLNVPLIHRDFRRVQLNAFPPGIEDESGSLFGLGDISLIGRWTPLRISEMTYSIVGSLFAGVKLPTGDTDRLEQEVNGEREAREFFMDPNGHYHAQGGIHQHDLTLGSGSYDAVFGGAITLRYDRWFFGGQAQYYLRTTGEGYRFGDEVIISGGPGAYVLLNKSFTLTLQANAVFDKMDPDVILDVESTETGWTAWYLGPNLTFTWGDHFSLNAGVDIPLNIDNNGIQTVPDYRFHGGLSWRF